MARKHRWLMSSLLLTWSLSHAVVWGGDGKDEAKTESAAEKIRKTLDQALVLDYAGQSLAEVVDHIREKTKLNISIDPVALQDAAVNRGNNGEFAFESAPVNLKADKNTKLGKALQRMLNRYNLTYVVLDDAVLITTDELGMLRQMRQRVSVNYKDIPLTQSVKELARLTAINIVIDPRSAKEAQAVVSLRIDHVTVETAVRLLAEMGGMKAVRMGNVLYITDDERAAKLREEEQPLDRFDTRNSAFVIPAGAPGVVGPAAAQAAPALPPGPPPPPVDPAK
jgi:type II secretory pathway component GspD/PulD (secretin)